MNKMEQRHENKSLLIMLLVIFIMILIYALAVLKTDVRTTSLEERLKYVDHTGRFEDELDSLTLKNIVSVTSNEQGNGTLWMAEVNEQKEMEKTNGQIYCVEPGDVINISEADGERIKAYTHDPDGTANSRTYEELVAMRDNTASTHAGPGCDPHADHVSTYHETSTTYFECKDEHYIESDSYTDRNGVVHDNLYDIAFLLSWRESKDFNIGDWTRLKQLIVWDSILCEKEGFSLEDDVRDTTAEEIRAIKTLKLYAGGFISEQEYYDVFGTNYAKLPNYTPKGYQTVMENIESNGGTMKIENGAKCGDEFFVDIDQTKKTIRMGPFSINYIDGRISDGSVAIGGISDMYLKDDLGNRINIDYIEVDHDNDGVKEAYEIDNDHKYNSFFSAIMPDNLGESAGIENINLLDYWEYSKIYPDPNQEFYIKFSYTGTEAPTSVQVNYDLQWLECKAELCMRDGKIYYITDEHSHSGSHHHPSRPIMSNGVIVDHTEPYDHPWEYCDITATIESAPAQGQVYIPSASREWKYDHDEIPVSWIPNPPPDDDEIIETFIPLTMKLGGKVFEDAQSGKENIGNGTLGSEDRALANIKVTLYEVTNNGLELAELASLDEERPEVPQSEIDNKDDWSRRINPTITDEYGYYEFRGLNLAKKYVVMFTYDGQNYFATQYLSTDGGNSTAYTSVQDMVSAGAYSTGEDNNYWLITSKGTELTNANDSLVDTTNIDENDRSRESLTYRFEEIGSHPKSYVSTNSLNTGVLTQDGGQYYNTTFSNYDLIG